MNQNKKMLFPIIGLILLDQLIKIIILINYMEVSKDIIHGIIAFHPIINRYYSWINSVFDMGISWIAHIILNVLVLLLSLFIFNYIRKKNPADRFVYWMFTFLFAGTVCSLVDKLFWGGSLDYVWIKGFFIFDLKDVYLTSFNILMIFGVVINYKGLRNLSTRKVLADLFRSTKKECFKKPDQE